MSARFTIAAAVIAAVGLMGDTSSAARQELTLAYRWTKGETLRYRMSQQSTSALSGMPGVGNVTVEQNLTQVIRTAVQGLDPDGTATLQQVIESVRIDMNTPAGQFNYDSAAADADAAAAAGPPAIMKKIFSAMVGAPFTLVLSPKGAVQKVEGVSGLVDKMAANLSGDPGSAGALAAFKQNFSDEAMRNMFSQGFVQFPDHAVKAGDTWTVKSTVNNPALGALTTTIDSTLVAAEGTGAAQTARIRTKLTVVQDKPSVNQMGLTAKLTDATGEGELTFDVAKGRVKGGTTTMTLPMAMSGQAPDGTPLSITSNIKTTIKIELMP